MMKLATYEWMVKPTPQTAWIEGKGILLYFAFFFIELGAALYLVSLLAQRPAGMLLGWLICLCLGGGLHLAFLGKPLRVYRAFLHPGTSWISRGIIFATLFSIVGLINLAASWDGTVNVPLTVLAGVIAFLEMIYAGFALSYVAALPTWNTALIPALYSVASLWGGVGILVALNLLSGYEVEMMESWSRTLLVAYGFLMALYLLTMRYRSHTAAASIERLIRGDLLPFFWGGVVLVGFIFPCLVNGMALLQGPYSVSGGFLVTAIMCEGIGDLCMRYCILKSALYSPLITAREI